MADSIRGSPIGFRAASQYRQLLCPRVFQNCAGTRATSLESAVPSLHGKLSDSAVDTRVLGMGLE